MERKQQNISELRDCMDETLGCSELTSKEYIRKLVQNQLHSSSPQIQEKRVTEISDLLDIMRSASGNALKALKSSGTSNSGWKIKQDYEDHRVMYGEGPQGSPFNTLLVEGYADGPLDACLCVGWEVALYKKWWPQVSFPTFKTSVSCCLKQDNINEQIALVRMKVPWPLSDREGFVDYFVLECIEQGLVIVLIKSISDSESADKHMQEFTDVEIPKSKDSVRMDLEIGGFAMKKISSDLSYFRTVGNIDIKLGFVPPALVNFISRQLLGSACKLYQKVVASATKGNEDFAKVLKEPLYTRVREHICLCDKPKETPGPEAL